MDRRTFLGASGTAAASLLGGCLGALGADDADGYDSIAKWTIPAQGDADPLFGYEVTALSPSRRLQAAGDTLNGSEPQPTRVTVWGDVEWAALDQVVKVRPPESTEFPHYRVWTGSFDTERARERLSELGEPDAGTYEGFELYEDVTRGSDEDGITFACGVRDGVVIQVGGWLGHFGTPEQVERVVDAAVGTTDRFPDEHQALGTAAGRIEPAPLTGLERQDPGRETSFFDGHLSGAEAVSAELRIDGDTVRASEFHVFESSTAADSELLEEYVAWHESRDRIELAAYDVEDRVAAVEYETPADRLPL